MFILFFRISFLSCQPKRRLVSQWNLLSVIQNRINFSYDCSFFITRPWNMPIKRKYYFSAPALVSIAPIRQFFKCKKSQLCSAPSFPKLALQVIQQNRVSIYGISKLWCTVFCKDSVLWIQLNSQSNFRRQAIHKVRIKSICTFFLKQHLAQVLYLPLSDPSQKIVITFGPKILITFHLQLREWQDWVESEHKKSVVNWDWENDIFFNQSEDTMSTFYSCAKLCYNSKEIYISMKIF